MSAISTILNNLRSAIWAIDVRDDIADAIEQCYSDVSNPTLQTEALEAALQTKIDQGEMAALTIGDHTILYAGVKVYAHCVIGKDCVLHAGVVVGSDGFGFEPDAAGVNHKIPQIGNVIIEDDVEIGANTTIDRAMMGSTIIRKNAKLDNLVQIAHNVEIGESTFCCAQVGVAGSTKVGKHCVLAGQVGVAGHIEIADNCVFGAQSGVANNVRKAGQYMGYPAIDASTWRRAVVRFKQSGQC